MIGKHTSNDDPCHQKDGIRVHASVVVGTKGQVVIPSDVRKTLNINPGDTMCVVTKHNKAVAMIRMDDMEEFMAYMQDEMDTMRRMILAHSNSK